MAEPMHEGRKYFYDGNGLQDFKRDTCDGKKGGVAWKDKTIGERIDK